VAEKPRNKNARPAVDFVAGVSIMDGGKQKALRNESSGTAEVQAQLIPFSQPFLIGSVLEICWCQVMV